MKTNKAAKGDREMCVSRGDCIEPNKASRTETQAKMKSVTTPLVRPYFEQAYALFASRSAEHRSFDLGKVRTQ